MTISLSDNNPRISYSVSAGVTQTSFTVPFEFFDLDDLNVYVDGVQKTKTTHYTLASGGSGSTGSITLSVTGVAGGSTVVITRDIDLERTTDFQTSGPFNIASLNTELDRFTAIAADLQDGVDRSLRLTDFDAAANLTLPDVNTRKGKTLAFNASTGAVEAGPSTSDVQTVSATAADIATLADIEDGTNATNAIQTVAGISGNVSTVAGISGNVTTVAGISANVTTVASDTTDIGTVASNISSVNTNATNISAIQGAAANASTATTKASEAAASQAAAASSASSASTSAATSTTKAAEAATSASNAATSAATASTQASLATTNGAAQVALATTQANNAASSATAASNSQTAAAASAASAATAFDNFDDTYLGSKTSNPAQDNDGNSLVSGALYFNSTANEMRVYDGANWIAATSAGNVSLILYEYTATAGQTTFSGSDDNSATLSYTADNLQVVMNGIVLDPSDFTATNGISVVLATGAAAGSLINIYAFKSFTVADTVSASAGGTFSANVAVTGDLTAPNLISASDALVLESNKASTERKIEFGNDYFGPIVADDNNIDLGRSGARFNDLYVGGSVYVGGTAAANALSDYEYGSWTPTLLANVTNPTVTVNGAMNGTYVKVGNIVHFTGYIDNVNVSGSSGYAFIGGLPFTSSDGGGEYWVFSYVHGTLLASSPSGGYVNNNDTKMTPIGLNSTSGVNYNHANNLYGMVAGSYRTAS
jgi:hypothetical protein